MLDTVWDKVLTLIVAAEIGRLVIAVSWRQTLSWGPSRSARIDTAAVLKNLRESACAYEMSASLTNLILPRKKLKEERRTLIKLERSSFKIRKVMGARSLEKALEILYSFETNSPDQSLVQISEKLRFPPSTVHRLLKVLASKDLIEQDSITRAYRLGAGILYLASITQNSLDVRRLALPVMERLRDSSGESVTLHELRGRMRVCIEKVDTTEVVRGVILVGSQLPLHCGASGKVLLAHMEEHELKQYLSEGPLEVFTRRTITDPNALRKQLKMIRKDGLAFSSGERVMDGLCAISAPIRDHNGRVNYSLTVSVPLHRLRVKRRGRLGRLVKQAALEISKKLGNGLSLQQQNGMAVRFPTSPTSKQNAAGA